MTSTASRLRRGRDGAGLCSGSAGVLARGRGSEIRWSAWGNRARGRRASRDGTGILTCGEEGRRTGVPHVHDCPTTAYVEDQPTGADAVVDPSPVAAAAFSSPQNCRRGVGWRPGPAVTPPSRLPWSWKLMRAAFIRPRPQGRDSSLQRPLPRERCGCKSVLRILLLGCSLSPEPGGSQAGRRRGRASVQRRPRGSNPPIRRDLRLPRHRLGVSKRPSSRGPARSRLPGGAFLCLIRGHSVPLDFAWRPAGIQDRSRQPIGLTMPGSTS